MSGNPPEEAAEIVISPGTPTTGQWCPKCLLPSIFVVPLNVVGADGVSTIGTFAQCEECGR